jgi:hypothetical protein
LKEPVFHKPKDIIRAHFRGQAVSIAATNGFGVLNRSSRAQIGNFVKDEEDDSHPKLITDSDSDTQEFECQHVDASRR